MIIQYLQDLYGYLRNIFRKTDWKSKGRSIDEGFLNKLRIANDIVLKSKGPSELQEFGISTTNEHG